MWILNWLELRARIREREKVCPTCEVLKVELSNLRREKERLLNIVLDKEPEPEIQLAAPEPIKINPKHIPHRVRQEMLEEDDRVKAEVLSRFAKRDEESRRKAAQVARTITPTTSIADLEAQLGVVQVD